MIRARAVLFDMAGTLVSMRVFRDYDAKVNDEFVRLAGLEGVSRDHVQHALAAAAASVTPVVMRQPFYLYHDLMAARYSAAAIELGAQLPGAHADRLALMWWDHCARNFRNLMAKGDGLRSGALETIQAIRAAGLHVGLVSNIDEKTLKSFLAVGDWCSHLDSWISSEQAVSCKPDPRIFLLALEQAGCLSEEALFVGDTPAQDISGARAVGLRTVLIQREDFAPLATKKLVLAPDHEISELAELLSILRL